MYDFPISPIHDVNFLGTAFFEAPAVYTRSRDVQSHSSLILAEAGVFHGQRPDGQLYMAEPGDVLFFVRGEHRDTWNDPERRFRGTHVMFQWRRPIPDFPRLVHDNDGRLRTLCAWMMDHSTRWRGEHVDICYGLLVAALAEHARLGESHADPLLLLTRQYMTDHLHERLTLQRLAEHAGLSRYHFARRFRELAGVSPMAEVQRRRLQAARTLLVTTDLPLKAIAARVGLADASHLSRLFRAHFGMGTREFRS